MTDSEREKQIEAYIQNYFTPEVHTTLVRFSWDNPHLEFHLNQNAIHIFTGMLAYYILIKTCVKINNCLSLCKKSPSSLVLKD